MAAAFGSLCTGVEGERGATLGPWRASARSAKILGSICSCNKPKQIICNFCRFSDILQFPHLPDMVFPDNVLSLSYSKGGQINFTALDALKGVDINRAPIQVACAEEWQESRSNTEKIIKPFDWTFTTDYRGTLCNGLELTPTADKIDIEMLKKKENIIFYEDISLYEDELHDHGIASCSVKIRMMPSCWFVLLRYFLRVDDVMARINDTRMFYQMNSQHIVVEHTSRESTLPELKLSPFIFTDPNELAPHLPLKSQISNKITLPE